MFRIHSITLPIRRFSLPQDKISRDIPTLSGRQFVVSKTGFSATQQELFWYRETLFDLVKARWNEVDIYSCFSISSNDNRYLFQPGTGRTGELSLRQQRLTLPMLETLRLEDLTIQLSIVPDDAEVDLGIKLLGGSRYRVPSNEFVHLKITVRNLSCEFMHWLNWLNTEGHLSAHHVPLALDIQTTRETPLEHILFQEPHLDIPLGILPPNSDLSAKDQEIGLCFLTCGEFGFVATVRQVGFNAAEMGSVVRSETAEIAVVAE